MGGPELPTLQPGGTLPLPATAEAPADGYTLDLEFSDDLEHWQTATTSTEGVKILSTTVLPNGDLEMGIQIETGNGRCGFWRVAAQ